jgi:uncharacterized membrane protein YecN with MAPEG domain
MSPAPMPFVAALYAGLVALLLVVLGANVSLKRRALKIGIGHAGNPQLERAVRVHANAIEWALPALLLLLIAELNRAHPLLLHLAGLAIFVGRVLHAFGLSRHGGVSFGRFYGSALSWTALLVLALWCVWAFARVLLV